MSDIPKPEPFPYGYPPVKQEPPTDLDGYPRVKQEPPNDLDGKCLLLLVHHSFHLLIICCGLVKA